MKKDSLQIEIKQNVTTQCNVKEINKIQNQKQYNTKKRQINDKQKN